VEVVLNLTVPSAHAPVALAALEAGKHVYNEKPLAITREEGRAILEAAAARGLLVGCAPDTFLGAGLQTARKVLDDGLIGRPVAFTAFMLGRGPERFHPNPEFFYQPGGGPMFDMGPYYLTALLNLLGPVRRLSAAAPVAIPDREVVKGPLAGHRISVNTPDHVCGTLQFESGAAGVIMTSFAVMHGTHNPKHPIAVYGTEGAMQVPDPNHFDGSVLVRREGEDEWREVPHASPQGYGRSIGLADLVQAVRSKRPPRASGDQGFAVLDLMQGFLDAAASGTDYRPTTPYIRPAPL
jgi:predicted dehydrogenase